MKRFRFPLHPVAVIRAHAELRARESLADSLRACAAAEWHMESWQRRLSDAEARIAEHRIEIFNGADVASQLHAYRADCAASDEAAAALRDARAAMQKRREEYIEANRALKVIENAEARARQEHRNESARAEQAEIDEFAGRKSFQGPASQ
ncbi:MAG TPA: flagellar FliJ family protein [Opitutaceae bacterium]|nr:flagellar FliJ family protein [Opitutaceae bacterium]